MVDNRKVIFLRKERGESQEEFEGRVQLTIEEEIKNGYKLTNTERKGGGLVLTFEK